MRVAPDRTDQTSEQDAESYSRPPGVLTAARGITRWRPCASAKAHTDRRCCRGQTLKPSSRKLARNLTHGDGIRAPPDQGGVSIATPWDPRVVGGSANSSIRSRADPSSKVKRGQSSA